MREHLNRQSFGTIALVGRILLAIIFITSGLAKIPGWSENVQYMQSRGIPAVPVFLFPAIFIEVIGGFSVLLGFKARLGAAALAIFLIPTSLIFHNFWALEGIEQQMQLVNFLKNLAIMGGLLQIIANGAGGASLDHWMQRRSTKGQRDVPPIREVS
ncbi:MAG: hypothetical protein A2X94_00730 [Bdellovibrionales bacterium GWB1_55_8]|nr:MAG: hypothetical protein A2X94_00730 [Bdellovibrionales bacterium GWB1_55_8]